MGKWCGAGGSLDDGMAGAEGMGPGVPVWVTSQWLVIETLEKNWKAAKNLNCYTVKSRAEGRPEWWAKK